MGEQRGEQGEETVSERARRAKQERDVSVVNKNVGVELKGDN